jgi:predicted nucleic acid-binding protein
MLVPQDVHHGAARRWLEERTSAGNELVAPVILLPEIGGAIARQTKSQNQAAAALELVRKIPGLRLVPVDHRLGSAAADLAMSLRLRGADAVYVAVASHLKIPMVTLDVEQRERAATVIEVRMPRPSRLVGRRRGGV